MAYSLTKAVDNEMQNFCAAISVPNDNNRLWEQNKNGCRKKVAQKRHKVRSTRDNVENEL